MERVEITQTNQINNYNKLNPTNQAKLTVLRTIDILHLHLTKSQSDVMLTEYSYLETRIQRTSICKKFSRVFFFFFSSQRPVYFIYFYLFVMKILFSSDKQFAYFHFHPPEIL